MKFQILYVNWQGKHTCIHPNDTTKVGNVYHWYVFLLQNSTMLGKYYEETVLRNINQNFNTSRSPPFTPKISFIYSSRRIPQAGLWNNRSIRLKHSFYLDWTVQARMGIFTVLKTWLRPEGILTSDFLFIVTTEKALLTIRLMPSHGYYGITRFFISLKS